MLSAKVSNSPGENLTLACWMGDDCVSNIVFSLEPSSWSSVYLNSLPKWRLHERISQATRDSSFKFLSRREMCWVGAAQSNCRIQTLTKKKIEA